ncbi:sarcoplasmic calcium-binding protein isoform X2 [Oratosquilla oratoria]|uniref:sarcoplasmic calcium-binding protein isoform X2 n=1 Tax=Oratosquilla oratoria TaxID=337810 RepID=UPI003F77795E
MDRLASPDCVVYRYPSYSVKCGPQNLTLPMVSSVRDYSKRYGKKKPRRASSSDSDSSSSSESDTDAGRRSGYKGRKGQSTFWRKKMRSHHVAIDVNKDGVVSWDDFEIIVKNFENNGSLAPTELNRLREELRHVWENAWGAAGDPYVFISQEQFLSNMEHMLNNRKMRKKMGGPLPYFFMAVDTDGSGEISLDEFQVFFKCLGLPEESAEETFNMIDVNGDGKISRKEFVRTGREFFLSEDESLPSKIFWGPLQA